MLQKMKPLNKLKMFLVRAVNINLLSVPLSFTALAKVQLKNHKDVQKKNNNQ